MRARYQQGGGWDDQDEYAAGPGGYDDDEAYADDERYADGDGDEWETDDERGLMLQTENSLVGISNTVTHHGVPLLSYTRTMNRFYNSRKQRLSLGRYKCEVCGERIRFWAWQTTTGTHTHDGCYERLAWTWTNLYAQQQRMAAEGQFE